MCQASGLGGFGELLAKQTASIPVTIPRNRLTVRRIGGSDDLHQLARAINAASWDDANEIEAGDYTAESIGDFVADSNRYLLVAHLNDQFAGIASATMSYKPYGHEMWLYVDEVDVVLNFRKRGVGKAMVRELLEIAEANHCMELWLGTEHDNESALALYKSLNPDEVEEFVGFVWQIRRTGSK